MLHVHWIRNLLFSYLVLEHKVQNMLGKTRANMKKCIEHVVRMEDKEHAYNYKIMSGEL
jgi:hypothetical protein